MFGLGIWQLERKAEKDVRLTQIQERRSNQPFSMNELMNRYASSSVEESNIQDFPVSFEGTANIESLFFIDNKILQGKVGYHVVVPILTIAGDAILVNLGWLRGNGIRGDLPSLPGSMIEKLVQKNINYEGTISYPSNNTMITETNTLYGKFPALLQQIDLNQIEQHLHQSSISPNVKLYPFIVNLAPDSDSEFVRNWQAVVMSPEKHLGYAAQWFGLGIAALTIYLLSLMKQLQTKNKKEN
jgi:cytochrome oxidase assembly protein ShyY1